MLQGNTIGVKKYGLNIYVLTHVTITSLSALLPCLIFGTSLTFAMSATGIIFATHLGIDIIRSYVNRHWQLTPDKYMFWVSLGSDQILHVSTLYLVANMV